MEFQKAPSSIASSGSYLPAQPYYLGDSVDRDPQVITGLDMLQLQPLTPPTAHDYAPGFFACPNLFASVRKEIFEVEAPGLEWEYNMRRDAQQILPFLYLGPTSAARNTDFLRREGITYLFAIRSRHSSHALIVNADNVAAELGIKTDHILVNDTQELISAFPEAIRRINDHICCCPKHQANSVDPLSPPQKKILVFCETGNERSASVVAAYLMTMFDLPVMSSLSNVQGRRLCANIDMSTRSILGSFQMILEAQRTVAKTQNGERGIPHATLPVPATRKRDYASSELDEEEMGSGTGNCETGAERRARAPFLDI